MATVAEKPVESKAASSGDGLELTLRKFTPEEYSRLIEEGIVGDEERLELLRGVVVNMMSKLPPHEVSVRLVSKSLDRLLPPGYDLRSQSAVTLRDSVPEPDCAVVIGDTRRYLDHHPRPDEIALVVEISESSLRVDRSVKSALYGQNGIPVYWIVNLVERQVEVLTEPTGDATEPAYAKTTIFKPGEKVPFTLAGAVVGEIAVADLLP